MYNKSAFCPCCGMQQGYSPSSRECKEILRERKSRHVELVDNYGPIFR
ncbi:MAG: hypothetical protein ACJ71H_16130 [Nitrososphaeraceae archaeon]